MNVSRRMMAGLAAVPVLVLGAAIPAAAQDAGEQTTAEESTEATPEESTAPTRAERFAQHNQELAAALAEELGLETEAVAAALETVQAELAEQRAAERRAALEERLAAAVADGSLTQEQADALLAAAEAGVLPGPGRRGGHGPRDGFGFGPPPGAEQEAAADATTS